MNQASIQRLALPPGPRGQHLRNLRKRGSKYADFMARLHEDYGEIVSFELPMMKCCAVFDAELINEILVTRASVFAPWYPGGSKNEVIRHGFLAVIADAGEHAARRGFMTKALGPDHADAHARIIIEKALELRDRCRPGQVVNIDKEMDRFVWDSVVGIILGGGVTIPRQLGKDFLEFPKLGILFNILPMSALLKRLSPALRRAVRAADTLAKYIDEAIRLAGDASDGVVSRLVLSSQENAEAPYRNARALRDEIIALMCVYVDAPTAAMTFGVHHIARNPAVRKRLEREVAAVAGDRQLEASDFNRLTYARAVCAEILRLEPPAYVMLPKIAVEDCELGGYRIPKGTLMHVAMRVLHHKAKHWDRANEFRPERWLEGPLPGAGKCPTHAYIPFGDGPHSCQGSGIARQMFVLGIATIVQRLRLEPVSNEPPKRENIGVGIADDFAVTVRAHRGTSGENCE